MTSIKRFGKGLYSTFITNDVVVWMSKKEKTSTSIKIDPELWKEAKIEAIRRDMEVSELVALALKKEISHKGDFNK